MAQQELTRLADVAACALIDLADGLERAGDAAAAADVDAMIVATARLFRELRRAAGRQVTAD